MLTDTTDVQPAETTAPESSPENETTTTEAVETTAPVEDAKAEAVPEQNRWAERARKAEKELETLRKQQEAANAPQPDPSQEAVKAQLKALGFITREEQEAELQRREQDSRVERELDSLSTKYNGKDGRPKFDRAKVLQYAVDNGIANAEVAYKAMHEQQLTDWAIQQAVTKTRGVKTEGSDGSGSSQVGVTTDDLKEGIRKGDRASLKTLIRRVTAAES